MREVKDNFHDRIAINGLLPGGEDDKRSRQYVDRPGFSLPVMSANFRRFNARVGVVFVGQNRLIHLFSWKHPTETMSFLAVYSLLCLRPHLLPLVPLVGLLLGIMLPAFLVRHPKSGNDPRVGQSYAGPPLAPATRPKPAPETSREFFRNMRDLQNSMDDFSRLHDAVNDYVVPYTDFSDEGLSSMLFVVLFALTCVGLIGSALVPWRFVCLAAGWIATISGHPEVKRQLEQRSNPTALKEKAWQLRQTLDADAILDEAQETRQVEIFELQRHRPRSDDSSWEPWLFTSSPFDYLSSVRVAGMRPKGTQFFEDVVPPSGWQWKGKKWTLDLYPREWVEQRLITSVGIECEGERWVYDLDSRDDETGQASDTPRAGWEEVTGLGQNVKHGEWRRRRWIRTVERKLVPQEGKEKEKSEVEKPVAIP
ncbi:integral peroxisomal membrane peroxin [Piedraia hortae CBS 480.64]|uniref:Integral peroxisomal membrane peroxin n=1 Tax=Piedraia hortae CBS 480.64 TaxID=1314780 RepID=A0A6A7BRR2_9PEZI|nr:integral peroxisomal membrane peroxin [Piedraia hortae CBS 480.64]